MATTTYGSPYVAGTDLVSGWPTASQNVANRIDDVSIKGNGINAQTGTTYTMVLTDAGKNITRSNGSASTHTIPTNASVAFPTGTVIGVTNLGAGAVTIDGSGVTINGSSLVLAQYEAASLMKVATDTWVVVKGGGIPKASISSTTGSPSTGANGGATYYKWTGDGSVTIGQAGTVQILIVAGGGSGSGFVSGSGYGGGGGGSVISGTVYLTAGTYNVKIGAGGSPATAIIASSGGQSYVGSLVAAGGAAGTYASTALGTGASGTGQSGITSSITGSSLGYGGGGGTYNGVAGVDGGGAGGTGAANGVAGTANRGGGGGGGGANASITPGAGGSGVVVILIGTV